MSDARYHAELHHDVRVHLTVNRCCECGRWWANERGRGTGCPHCMNEALAELYANLEKQGRTITGLKGALTKAKKKLAKATNATSP